MTTDSEKLDRLISLAERLPAAQSTLADCLARQRERTDEADFHLTEAQREQVEGILAALALGREGNEIPKEVEASERIAELAERVRTLREAKKSIEEELVLATGELVQEAGVGVTAATSTLRVRIGEPRLSVKIKDAKQLPPAFLCLQPDRKSILAHVRAAAEVPPGAEISETRATVYFSKP